MTHPNEFKMDITTSADGAIVSVALRGDVDTKNADTLCAVVRATHNWVRVRRVVIDLTAVASMDLSGTVALVMCRSDLHAAGVGFDVVGARNDTLGVLRLTGVLGTCQRRPTTMPAKLRKYL